MSDAEQAALESAIASEEGSAPEAPAESGAEESVFHTYKDRDGNVMEFKSQDDLNKFIERGTMRHSRYDKTMKELSAKEKEILEQRQKYQSEESRLNELRSKYDRYDEFFNTPRGRQVFSELQNAYKGVKPDDVVSEAKEYADSKVSEVSEELKGQLEEFKSWKAEQERQANEAWVHEQLAQQYDGYDRSIVEETLKELEEVQSLDEREQTKALYDLIYQAKAGNLNVAQVEQKLAQSKPTNKGLKSTKASAPTKGKEPATLEEAEEMLAEEFANAM